MNALATQVGGDHYKSEQWGKHLTMQTAQLL